MCALKRVPNTLYFKLYTFTIYPSVHKQLIRSMYSEPFSRSTFYLFIIGKTHLKKSVFFSGRTTKGVGRVNPPDH